MKSVLIVGGGFFGLYLAEHLTTKGVKVIIAEKESQPMQRASYVNQARVHNGYHYPRSILTALRSRVSFPRFAKEFRECISDEFDKYYMVGKVLSKVTAKQFELFCHRIGAPIEPAPSKITGLVNRSLVEATYQTVEYAFNADKLRQVMLERLRDAKVEFLHNTEVIKIQSNDRGYLSATVRAHHGLIDRIDKLSHVFNCTYSMINQLNLNSGQELVALKHELTEMALVKIPDELSGCGVTVMCGPFFSFMPFPSKQCHSFSHVRYTPHYEWQDSNNQQYINAHRHLSKSARFSSWNAMWRDATRYIPVLEDCQYKESLWEVKTVLPRSDSDDSRPILFRPNHGLQGYHCVMGGKIDNVYDAVRVIDQMGLLN